MQAGNPEAAYTALENWLLVHPEDAALRILLATAYQRAGRTQQAIEQYLQALGYAPDNVAVLNNLAWLFQEQGSQQGLIYAERAYELAPGKPEVMDTLGWLLLQKGDTNRGLLLLQEAAVKAPHMAEIRYHMAVGLAKVGRNDEARRELGRLLKTGKEFQGVAEARKLRQQLGS